MAYRNSRNIEASIIDYLTEKLEEDNWIGIRVEKSFTQVYQGTLPCICVSVLDIRPQKLEIGSKTNLKYFTIDFKIFATSDGQRLDLSDWLLDLLEDDIDFYSYTITNGVISSKVLSGKIILTKIFSDKKELVNTENLEKEDKYRHLISIEVLIAQA
jgi:hypothetical protein